MKIKRVYDRNKNIKIAMREELLDVIKRQSYEKRKVVLSSGRDSDFYIDGKMTTTDPWGAFLVGRLMFERIKNLGIDGVGGLTIGADPIATAIAIVSNLEGRPISAFFVRKEQKKHGKQLWIEGGWRLKEGSKVVIVEDVITTGGSALKAIEKSEGAGFIVVEVLTLIDRNEGGRENLKKSGYKLESIFTMNDILEKN
ncbi:MAG: orotate phosphoribosyltransferase [Nitrospinota bacterium]